MPLAQHPSAPKTDRRVPLTHFLCLPLVNETTRPVLRDRLASFRAECISRNEPVPADAIRPPSTLHLTLGVMRLPGSRLDEATQLLSSLDLYALLDLARTQYPNADHALSRADLAPLRTTLHSLRSTAGRATSVLYAAPTDADGTLMRFCEAVRDAFVVAGLMDRETRPLLLHATVVNTIYARSAPAAADTVSEEGSGTVEGRGRRVKKRGKGRVRIDAAELMARYEGHVWAEDVLLDRVAICTMGAKPLMSAAVGGPGDMAYEEVASVAMPGL